MFKFNLIKMFKNNAPKLISIIVFVGKFSVNDRFFRVSEK
jgi:hypothetical protein